jgi:hypothetical protein
MEQFVEGLQVADSRARSNQVYVAVSTGDVGEPKDVFYDSRYHG